MAVAAEPGTTAPSLEKPSPSLELREALPQEREQAWSLQRAAFNLSPGAFPSHPGERQELRVAVRDGRVLSCLTLLHAPLSLRGVPVAMGGLRHVATHPEEQNQGHASALVRQTLHAMREQDVLVSVLFPFSFRYYRKFGYELGGNYCHFWCRPNCIPAYAERSGCTVAGLDHADTLATYYGQRLEGASCGLVRGAARWAGICSDPRYSTVLYGQGEPEGYAVLEETRDSYGGRLMRVLDLGASSPKAWRGLLGYLSQAPVESVEWLAGAEQLAQSGLMRSTAPLREGFKPRGIATIRPMFQFRVTDVAGLLQALAPTFPSGRYRLALKVRDELIPGNNRPVTVHGLGDRVEIKTARPSDPSLEADIRILSQIMSGYMSPSEAVSQDLARCSSPEALETAECLFPGGDPFISELDRF